MDLAEITENKELLQDKWSVDTQTFGIHHQLSVRGYIIENQRKVYIVKCEICSKDPELFGEGYFKTNKQILKNNLAMPCGCGRSPRWSVKQYEVLCNRAAGELGYVFKGFSGEWRGNTTKVTLVCKIHGEWSTGCILNLLTKRHCPECARENLKLRNTCPDSEMIASFFASEAFPEGTIFTRSPRKVIKPRGTTIGYWYVFCPVCGQTGESLSYNLKKGRISCSCSKARQLQCYINSISSQGEDIALKFGIANSPEQRIKRQDRLSVYEITNKFIYLFPNRADCLKAERECRQEIECGVLSKQEMPDGWTETTWTYNLDKIIEIYERNGGIILL